MPLPSPVQRLAGARGVRAVEGRRAGPLMPRGSNGTYGSDGCSRGVSPTTAGR
ncbi:hypothetical protein ACNF49_39815 [Actinomadura sp. ATCC 39365]